MRLSEAIRKGIPITTETRGFCGCAIGAAWAAVNGRQMTFRDRNKFAPFVATQVARTYGWDEGLARYISNEHFQSRMTREQCADYAEQWEREHGLIPQRESPAQFASRMVDQIKGMAKALPKPVEV